MKVISEFIQAVWKKQLIVFLISLNLSFQAVEHPEFWKTILILKSNLEIPYKVYIHTYLTSLYKNV
jgi:hypothetical protein